MPENTPKIYLIDLPKEHETPEVIEAIIEGESVEVPALPGKTIIESLLAADQKPMYSCLQGHCMACLAQLKEGSVGQVSPGILTESHVNDGEFLACQAIPLSKKVLVDFGEF